MYYLAAPMLICISAGKQEYDLALQYLKMCTSTIWFNTLISEMQTTSSRVNLVQDKQHALFVKECFAEQFCTKSLTKNKLSSQIDWTVYK